MILSIHLLPSVVLVRSRIHYYVVGKEPAGEQRVTAHVMLTA